MLDSCPLCTRVPRLDPFLYGTERDGQESSDECLGPTGASAKIRIIAESCLSPRTDHRFTTIGLTCSTTDSCCPTPAPGPGLPRRHHARLRCSCPSGRPWFSCPASSRGLISLLRFARHCPMPWTRAVRRCRRSSMRRSGWLRRVCIAFSFESWLV